MSAGAIRRDGQAGITMVEMTVAITRIAPRVEYLLEDDQPAEKTTSSWVSVRSSRTKWPRSRPSNRAVSSAGTRHAEAPPYLLLR